jgi:integrase/recombinase XerC
MQGKQAKVLSPTQERAIVGYLDTTRYPMRDRVIFLLSIKAGLRAKEIASLTWAMVTDAEGQIAEVISLQNRASKGKTGGRTIPMHPEVYTALVTLQTWRGDAVGPDRPLIFSERGGGLSPATVRLWFHRLYTSLKMDGCSSHSGPGSRRPYESRDDATLHRGRYGGQAETRRTDLKQSRAAEQTVHGKSETRLPYAAPWLFPSGEDRARGRAGAECRQRGSDGNTDR